MMNIIFSILIGFSIGLILSSYNIRKLVYHGPNSQGIKEKIYKKGNICYKLKSIIVKCPFGAYHE